MNEEILNFLDKDKLYNLTRKNYLEKHYKLIYDNLYVFKQSFYNDLELPFAQLVYLYAYGLKNLPVCLKCNRDKLTFVSFSQGYKKYCSKDCGNHHKAKLDKAKQTCFEKYGVENASQSEVVKKKKEENSLKKYGVKSPLMLKEIRDKCEATCFEKYGEYNVSKVKELYEKQRVKYNKTLKEKYNVNHISQVESVKEKKRNTSIANYGVSNPFLSKEIQKKKLETVTSKYGVDNVMKVKSVINKKEKTNLKRYGVENPMFLKRPGKTSLIEKAVCQQVNGKKIKIFKREYDFVVDNDVFEIDGDFFHPLKKENLYVQQLNSIINDFRKTRDIKKTNYNFYRVYVSSLPKDLSEVTIDFLKKNSYTSSYAIEKDIVLLSKEKYLKYIKTKGEQNFFKYLLCLIDICREIGKIDLTKEEILKRIKILITNEIDISFKNIIECN